MRRQVLPWVILLVLLHASSTRAQQRDLAIDYDAPNPERTAVDYARAAANVAFVNFVIWQVAWLRHKDWAPVDRESLERNLQSSWELDVDTLRTNFFGHPYHGGLQFNAARGAGLSFWESFFYLSLGSLTWEYFAEREKPAFNDLVVTTLGGMMLGEITYRLSSAVLDDADSGGSRLLRELGATAVSPMRGFNRLSTGQAWRDGPAPVRHPLRLELDVGVDQIRAAERAGDLEPERPAALLAVDIDYGDLLPIGERATLGPFDFFEFYGALSLFNSEIRGEQVYSSALLYGLDSAVSDEPGRLRDNNVFGFAMSYDYVGANYVTYSGFGIGPANYLVIRLGGARTVRLSLGFDVVPFLAASTPVVTFEDRDYNFAAGLAGWGGVDLGMGRAGELGLRTRHYVTTVVDGVQGSEVVGSMRLWYELDLFSGIGLGVAPTLFYRRGSYRDMPKYTVRQLSTQAYLSVHH